MAREVKDWITINHQHVPIYEGQSKKEVAKAYVDKMEKKEQAGGKKESEKNEEKKPDKDTKKSVKVGDKEVQVHDDKEKKLAELQKQYDEAKGIISKSKIKTEMDMVKADWKGTREEWLAKKEEEHQKAVKESLAKREAEEKAKQDKKDAEKKNLEEELKTQPKDKVDQYKLIQETNPMNDDYHVGIRKPSDIKTWKEVVDSEDNEDFAWGDFSREDAEKALDEGMITVYSSYPIEQGVFVSTSKAQSEQYAGGEGSKVYSKKVPLEDVAWISGDEGQFAKLDKGGSGKTENPLVSKVKDNTDFKQFIKDNIDDPEFKQYGREHKMEAVKDLWYEKRQSEELKGLQEVSKEKAIEQIRDAIPSQTSHMWFVEADSDIKPKLVDSIMSNKGTLNAGLNIAYSNYKEAQESKGEKVLDFETWATTPMEFYRGDRGQKEVGSDIFASYTTDKKVAARFTKSDSGSASVKDDLSDVDMSKITTVKLRPIDTWGSYQTTAEQEYLIPMSVLKKGKKEK